MIKRGEGTFGYTVTDATGDEIDVEVVWRGYSDPGVASGPVERCCPPEGEIEILSITRAHGISQDVSPEDAERIKEAAWDQLERGQ